MCVQCHNVRDVFFVDVSVVVGDTDGLQFGGIAGSRGQFHDVVCVWISDFGHCSRILNVVVQ